MGDRVGLYRGRTKFKTKYKKSSLTRTKLEEQEETEMGKQKSEPSTSATKDITKERKPKSSKRERWLLTRKTWRYMADAGRKLIPEGALNRPEDVPKIEQYFQEICRKEPRFLLWRKQSYPGALGFRAKGRGRGGRLKSSGSCREKTSSADEAEDVKKAAAGTSGLAIEVKQQGRFDLKKLREEFLLGTKSASSSQQKLGRESGQLRPPGWTGKPGPPKSSIEEDNVPTSENDDKKLLLETLKIYLKEKDLNQTEHADNKTGGIDHEELLAKLRQHLESIDKVARNERLRQPMPSGVQFEGDHAQKMLLETLRRHFSKSTNRDKVISDLLTDRKLLEKLHFDLRKARGFTGSRRGVPSLRTGSDYSPKWSPLMHERETYNEEDEDEYDLQMKPNFNRNNMTSPPPTIEIEEVKEQPMNSSSTQTARISDSNMTAIEAEIKRQQQLKVEAAAQEQKEQQKSSTFPRRTSVTDNDDVSPSVSDTIRRYLRMARKKSIDSDKSSRFNTVNYDRNLRNIKPKGEITKISDDDGLDKGSQTNESWIVAFKELKLEDPPSPGDASGSRITSPRSSLDTGTEEFPSPTLSPPTRSPSGILSSGQNFLSNLLYGQKSRQVTGSSVPTAVQAMQKSKSSSNVVHHGSRLVAKKIWKARSKSSSRAAPSVTSVWTPQGRCVWTNVTGRSVTLTDTSLLHLTEIERKVLQKVALAKLQALNLGVNVRIPSDNVNATSVQKPKRRAYLIKRKAITTSIFDTNRGKDDKEKGEGTTAGSVFGVPLGQCVENERLARIEGESRSGDACGGDEHSELRRKSHHGSRGSFSSLNDFANKQEERGSCESLISPTLSMPGMLDTLSCSSAIDLSSEHSRVPNIVTSCLRHLENYGLHTLGIFRVSSSKKRVRQLREEFDCGKEILLNDQLCPHDVATLLKEYFRDLPDSLLCKDLYQAFIQTQRIRNRRLQNEALKHLIELLPVANRDTLWALLNTLSIIAYNANDHKDVTGDWVSGNKMDSNNLATLFAPNILHSCPKTSGLPSKDELSAERTEERSDAINVIRTLIDNYRSLFQVPAELLDEVYVHMMDSHPDVLDQLLQRREVANDDLQDDQETSTVSEDTGATERLHPPVDSQESLLSTSSDDRGGERRIWSREAFTHEHAGMGGPDVEMRPRKERERTRERITKKRWKEEPTGRRRLDSDHSGGGSTTPSRRTSATYQDDDRGRYYSSADTSGQQTPDDQMIFGDRSMDVGVITASLKIPVPASTSFTLNLDDTDIPFIEDSERQQMTFGMVRSSSSSHRMSGSDSSQASTYIHQIQYPGQTDSAVGSSAGVSSPPRNTTPSVSSYSSGGVFSSPPSWASSPPTSPDHSVTTVNYIPEEATTARIIIPTKQQQKPVILQRVTIKSTGEVQQIKPGSIQPEQTGSPNQERRRSKDVSVYQRLIPSISEKLMKSASSSAVSYERTIPIVREGEQTSVDKAVTTSISSIGGAVLRSKTEDIERMIRLQNNNKQTKKSAVMIEEDKKSKRRYADTRHQARIIPITTETDSQAGSSSPRSSEQRKSGVWKRRELISSEPKDRKGVSQ